MTEIHQDAQAVHLSDDLFAEVADAVVGVAASCGVADIVVAVVTKRHIDDAAVGEVLQVADVALQRQSVLDGEHDALASLALVAIEVVGCASQRQIVGLRSHDAFYLVEDAVGVTRRGKVEG